jgi:2',3'-cyclic-nucleotide 2'-phosphodiesterase (5'-nucleotidase family)
MEAPVSFTVVEADITDDPHIESLVAPFRNRMGEEIRQQIGETTGMLSKALPEGTLGNFATDAMLWAANQMVMEPVQMALTNNGGLRIPIGPGAITVGQMYELMPFENMLSVLVLSGAQVKSLCDELADRRGAPISGFSFRMETREDRRIAADIRIGGEPLDPEAEYHLVTNDYMANGGDSYPSLMNPLVRIDLPVLLRDAFIDYVKHKGVIEPELEGRITGGIGR